MQQAASFMVDMDSSYPGDIQFAGLVEAATAAADAHQRDLGKRKRGEENAYNPVSTSEPILSEPSKTPTLSNSAAILFREPSEKSKKYSRPPLGKVFTSLQLAPEAFLRLQHAAKAYMLSDENPERKDVVGHKKLASNNDVAKLKLYECVEEFLQRDNIGEQFFGRSSNEETADAQPRTFFWPEDRNKIVKLLMPLLRKMVTNERQRIYAAETRKQDPKRTEARSQKSQSVINDGAMTDNMQLAPEIDPSLQIEPKLELGTMLPGINSQTSTEPGSLILKINVVRTEGGVQRRLVPEMTIPSADASTLEQLHEELKKRHLDMTEIMNVKVLQASGLTVINDNTEWLSAQMAVSMYEWMDGSLKVVVEI